jgi:hypothetical protein
MDSHEIDDDQEMMMNDLWNKVLAHKGPMKVELQNVNDVYVLNGNAILFALFFQKTLF